MSIAVTIKCRKYPRYTGKRYPIARYPSGPCSGCTSIYNLRRALNQSNRRNVLSGIDRSRLDDLIGCWNRLATNVENRR